MILSPWHIDDLDTVTVDLPKMGEIKFTETGFCYLDIDDAYIHKVFPLINVDGVQKPDYFAQDTDFIGAHISLVYPEENIASEHFKSDVITGFSIKSAFTASLKGKVYYGLQVVSPLIVEFRQRLGLSELLTLKGYSIFPHITVAVSRNN